MKRLFLALFLFLASFLVLVGTSIEDFKKGLAGLSIKDWEYILKELGY